MGIPYLNETTNQFISDLFDNLVKYMRMNNKLKYKYRPQTDDTHNPHMAWFKIGKIKIRLEPFWSNWKGDFRCWHYEIRIKYKRKVILLLWDSRKVSYKLKVIEIDVNYMYMLEMFNKDIQEKIAICEATASGQQEKQKYLNSIKRNNDLEYADKINSYFELIK